MLHTKKVGYLDGSPEDLIMSQWNETKTASKNRNVHDNLKSFMILSLKLSYKSKDKLFANAPHFAFEYNFCCKIRS